MGRFRTKIKASWFSDDFIVLRYSTNGIFWRTVKEYKYDSYEKRYSITDKTVVTSSVKFFLNSFDSLEKIKQHHKEQIEIVNKGNANIAAENRKHKSYLKDFYKKYG